MGSSVRCATPNVPNIVPHRRKETIRKGHGDMTHTGCLMGCPKNRTTFQTRIHRKKRVQYRTFLLALEWESHNAIQAGLQLMGSSNLPTPPSQAAGTTDIPSLENVFFRLDPEL